MSRPTWMCICPTETWRGSSQHSVQFPHRNVTDLISCCVVMTLEVSDSLAFQREPCSVSFSELPSKLKIQCTCCLPFYIRNIQTLLKPLTRKLSLSCEFISDLCSGRESHSIIMWFWEAGHIKHSYHLNKKPFPFFLYINHPLYSCLPPSCAPFWHHIFRLAYSALPGTPKAEQKCPVGICPGWLTLLLPLHVAQCNVDVAKGKRFQSSWSFSMRAFLDSWGVSEASLVLPDALMVLAVLITSQIIRADTCLLHATVFLVSWAFLIAVILVNIFAISKYIGTVMRYLFSLTLG